MSNTEALPPRRLVLIFALLLPLVVMYLMTAFVLWDVDPAAWSETARFFTALLGLMFSVVSVCICQEITA